MDEQVERTLALAVEFSSFMKTRGPGLLWV